MCSIHVYLMIMLHACATSSRKYNRVYNMCVSPSMHGIHLLYAAICGIGSDARHAKRGGARRGRRWVGIIDVSCLRPSRVLKTFLIMGSTRLGGGNPEYTGSSPVFRRILVACCLLFVAFPNRLPRDVQLPPQRPSRACSAGAC